MPQHEFPSVTFECFPHGRPKQYQQPGIVDIMLASLPPQVFTSPRPPLPPLPPNVPAKTPTPRVEVEKAFKDALIEEIQRLNEPVKITGFVTEYGRGTFSKGNWRDFERRPEGQEIVAKHFYRPPVGVGRRQALHCFPQNSTIHHR